MRPASAEAVIAGAIASASEVTTEDTECTEYQDEETFAERILPRTDLDSKPQIGKTKDATSRCYAAQMLIVPIKSILPVLRDLHGEFRLVSRRLLRVLRV